MIIEVVPNAWIRLFDWWCLRKWNPRGIAAQRKDHGNGILVYWNCNASTWVLQEELKKINVLEVQEYAVILKFLWNQQSFGSVSILKKGGLTWQCKHASRRGSPSGCVVVRLPTSVAMALQVADVQTRIVAFLSVVPVQIDLTVKEDSLVPPVPPIQIHGILFYSSTRIWSLYQLWSKLQRKAAVEKMVWQQILEFLESTFVLNAYIQKGIWTIRPMLLHVLFISQLLVCTSRRLKGKIMCSTYTIAEELGQFRTNR